MTMLAGLTRLVVYDTCTVDTFDCTSISVKATN
jgi:hypothetical protein